MIGRIGIFLLVITMLAGCSKKDEGATAKKQQPAESSNAQAQGPQVEPGGSAPMQTDRPTVPTKIGDAAYPLMGLTWIKGEPVGLGGGKVTVVEFWATWCPPCRVSIPHLTALQAKYKDRGVVFVGISTETEAEVRPFVKEMGDKMAYHVAIDTTGKTSGGYMTAFRQNGIPTAFVVDAEGKVRWVGHPMEMESVLDKVVSGT